MSLPALLRRGYVQLRVPGPNLLPSLQTYGELFAGGGGWGIGATAAGLQGLWAIERSKPIAQIHCVNAPTVPVYIESVELVDPSDLLSHGAPDVIFASPPCQGWSKARSLATSGSSRHKDKDVATSITHYVEVLKPKLLLVENVTDFANYKLFRQFRLDIEALGYRTKLSKIEFANFGVPQTRLRVLLSATIAPEYPKDPYLATSLDVFDSQPPAWFPAVADLLPRFVADVIPPSVLSLMPYPDDLAHSFAYMASSLANVRIRSGGKLHHASHASKDILAIAVQTAHSHRKNITFRGSTQPMFTLVASLAKQPTRILLPTGQVLRMPMRANARLQTFPDSYKIPVSQTLAGTIIGNAVPPMFVTRLMGLYNA